MITIPLYCLLLGYGLFLVICTGFFLMNINNLVRSGTFTITSFLATLFFLSLSVTTILISWHYLQIVDWQQPLTLWNNAWGEQILGNIFTIN